MTTILCDEDVVRRLTARDAVRWMGDAIDAQFRGELISPPRVHAGLGDARIVFTTGRLHGSWFGYRSYSSFPGQPEAQLVVVQAEDSGEVRALAIGNELGPRRVGAIGGVAADALAPEHAGVVAVIGSGLQAHMQVWGLAAVRTIRELRVYSPNPAHRKRFAARVRPLVGTAGPVADARTAVDGAEIVVLATASATPVIDAGWIGAGAYVTTLGPKQRGHAEFGLDLPEAASLLVTDSLDQVDAYDPPNVLAGTAHRDRLVSLGAVRAGEADVTATGGIRLFFSVGLAGTEAFLLDRLTSDV